MFRPRMRGGDVGQDSDRFLLLLTLSDLNRICFTYAQLLYHPETPQHNTQHRI
jgi:hypothetical protein